MSMDMNAAGGVNSLLSIVQRNDQPVGGAGLELFKEMENGKSQNLDKFKSLGKKDQIQFLRLCFDASVFPLHIAVDSDDNDLMEALCNALKNFPDDESAEFLMRENQENGSVLCYAAKNEKAGMVTQLLKAAIDPEKLLQQKSPDGETPIFTAVRTSSKLVRAIVDGAGANKVYSSLFIENCEGELPLHYSLRIGRKFGGENIGYIRMLYTDLTGGQHQGIHAHADRTGRCLVHYAAEYGGREMLSSLIVGLTTEEKIEILFMAGPEGKTPWDLAIMKNNVKFFEALPSLWGKNTTGEYQVVNLLYSGGESLRTALKTSSKDVGDKLRFVLKGLNGEFQKSAVEGGSRTGTRSRTRSVESNENNNFLDKYLSDDEGGLEYLNSWLAGQKRPAAFTRARPVPVVPKNFEFPDQRIGLKDPFVAARQQGSDIPPSILAQSSGQQPAPQIQQPPQLAPLSQLSLLSQVSPLSPLSLLSPSMRGSPHLQVSQQPLNRPLNQPLHQPLNFPLNWPPQQRLNPLPQLKIPGEPLQQSVYPFNPPPSRQQPASSTNSLLAATLGQRNYLLVPNSAPGSNAQSTHLPNLEARQPPPAMPKSIFSSSPLKRKQLPAKPPAQANGQVAVQNAGTPRIGTQQSVHSPTARTPMASDGLPPQGKTQQNQLPVDENAWVHLTRGSELKRD